MQQTHEASNNETQAGHGAKLLAVNRHPKAWADGTAALRARVCVSTALPCGGSSDDSMLAGWQLKQVSGPFGVENRSTSVVLQHSPVA